MLDGTEYFECMCHSDEHAFRVTLDLDEGEKDPALRIPCIYASVYLNPSRGFWSRLWYGLRYAFGYQSKYGAFYSWMMGPEEARKLKTFIERLPDPRVDKVTFNELPPQVISEALSEALSKAQITKEILGE